MGGDAGSASSVCEAAWAKFALTHSQECVSERVYLKIPSRYGQDLFRSVKTRMRAF